MDVKTNTFCCSASKVASTLCLKNDTDVAHYNFYYAVRVCYQMVICYPTSPN